MEEIFAFTLLRMSTNSNLEPMTYILKLTWEKYSTKTLAMALYFTICWGGRKIHLCVLSTFRECVVF